MKTLYISDLDGTLLNSGCKTSEFTESTINRLCEEKGMIFSYATARSFVTAKRACGVKTCSPLIVYNGAFIVDSFSGKPLVSNFLGDIAGDIISQMIKSNIFPIVYSYIDGEEKFSFLKDHPEKAVRDFLRTRLGFPDDRRPRPVELPQRLFDGEIFYVSCLTSIEETEKFLPLYDKYKNACRCLVSKDIYSESCWLEIMPKSASKAQAVRKLKSLLDCDRVVAFGDGVNDLDMFAAADECYAVENAVPELKAAANGVIPSNNEDGVARWLEEFA